MFVEIKTIHNRKEYKAALEEIELLWSAPAKSAEAVSAGLQETACK
jgi:hypothetical protein